MEVNGPLVAAFVVGITTGGIVSYMYSKINRSKRRTEYKNHQSENSEEYDSDEDSDVDGSEPLKMVLVVRQDLKMGKGKIAAQCCHACLGSYELANREVVLQWKRLGQTKVALKCETVEQLTEISKHARLLGVPNYIVCDAGRTQIAAGSQTVCGVGPAPESLVNKITGHLKLL